MRIHSGISEKKIFPNSFIFLLNIWPDILEGYDTVERDNQTLSAQLDALADLKFTYVVSCQKFGTQKSAGDPRAQDIIDLMIRYCTSLRKKKIAEILLMQLNKLLRP